MTHERGCLGLLLGFIVGSVVGGLCALLFAPGSGEETRRWLRQRSVAWRRDGGNLGKEPSSPLTVGAQMIRAMATQLRRRFDEAVQEGRKASALKRQELLSQIGRPPPTHS